MSEASRAPAPSHATLPRLAEPPATVFEHLVRRFPHVGEDAWSARLAGGTVTFDDGERVSVATPYRAGARVRYFRAVAQEPVVPFTEEILYRDERILIADKPHFLPVTPGGPYVNECLTYRLRRRTGLDALQAVHRLDRDTAGLVLFAVAADVRGVYAKLFMDGRVEKEYLAVASVPEEPERRTWEVANRIVRGEPWFRMRIAPGPVNARRLDLARGVRRLTRCPGSDPQRWPVASMRPTRSSSGWTWSSIWRPLAAPRPRRLRPRR